MDPKTGSPFHLQMEKNEADATATIGCTIWF